VIGGKRGLMIMKLHCSRGGVFLNRNSMRRSVVGDMTAEERRVVG
jgi:hypothetical protein